MNAPNPLLEATLVYAQNQPVLPVDVDKTPLVLLEQASHDPEVIRAWFSELEPRGIALRTDNFIVIDVAAGAEPELARLEDELGALPLTREQRTPSGGRHLLYRRPEGPHLKPATLALGISMMAGAETWIVAPPSRNGQGRYTWLVRDGEESPDPLVDLTPNWISWMSGQGKGGMDKPLTGSSTLANLFEQLRQYMDVGAGEEGFILGVLISAVSKALTDEEPLWLMLVGAPSSGKSEAIRLLDLLADLRVDELTRAGLLSWGTGAGKKSKKVGILTRIPPHSLVTVSDFSTVITASDREGRARMFGMLRVVYDGHVYRGIGGEPAGDGNELEWSGHLTLIAAATPIIDAATAFEGALGERWLTLRLAESDTTRAVERARYILDRRDVTARRKAVQTIARDLVLEARTRIPQHLPDDLPARLVNLAVFVAHARTGVQHEGNGAHRVIVGIPTPEEPTRLVGQLTRFARCAIALGLTPEDALRLSINVAHDSVPLGRMRALRAVAELGEAGATVSDVHRALIRGNRWAAIWELDALDAIGLVDVEGPSREEDRNAHRVYRLNDAYRKVYESVGRPLSSLPNKEKKDKDRGSVPTDSHTTGDGT